MNYSIKEALKTSENKYELIVKIAKRARQLVGGEKPLVKTDSENPVMIALIEIEEGKVRREEK